MAWDPFPLGILGENRQNVILVTKMRIFRPSVKSFTYGANGRG